MSKEQENLRKEFIDETKAKLWAEDINEDVGFSDKYVEWLEAKQLNLTGVGCSLPSVKSKEFQRWTQSKGYEPAFNGLWYEKNKVTYETKVLYRAFTNEIEFGN